MMTILMMRRSKLVEGSLGSSLWDLQRHPRLFQPSTFYIGNIIMINILPSSLLKIFICQRAQVEWFHHSNWLFDDIFVVASNKEFSTYILLHFAVTIYFWQLRMWQTFSWVSIQVNGAADIDYWKILSRWPSTFTGSHFNIQIHTAVDFKAHKYMTLSPEWW